MLYPNASFRVKDGSTPSPARSELLGGAESFRVQTGADQLTFSTLVGANSPRSLEYDNLPPHCRALTRSRYGQITRSIKMKSSAAIFCIALLGAGYSHAQTAPSVSAPAAKGNLLECRSMMQQRKITGDERRTFMRECMKDVIADCRTKATTQKLQGDDRKSFVRSCLGRPDKPSKT
jgi:hypothetical protein